MKTARVMTVLACVLVASMSAWGAPARKTFRIRPAEAASVTFVKYRDPSGYFSLDLPRGWQVKVGLKSSGKIDLISYAIRVYDP